MDKYKKIEKIFEKEKKLIKIKKAKKVIFVGDTHGDIDASEIVLKKYLKKRNVVVFLGDYVDRGPYSKENIEFLLENKLNYPDKIYLLQGNHETHRITSFWPADFWRSLSNEEYNKYSSLLEKLPLVAIVDNIIALHGALPNVKNLEDINKIKIGSEEWYQIVWGDFLEEEGNYLGIDIFSGRPKFGSDYFFNLIERFNKKILIRSHQPDIPMAIFDNKCLTIFTSNAYSEERTIAIADLSKKIESVSDLKIKYICLHPCKIIFFTKFQ